MLEAAYLHKDELLELCARQITTVDWFYYCGCSFSYELPNFDPADDYGRWASVDKSGDLQGFICYHIDGLNNCAHNFGIYSFVRDGIVFARDLAVEMEYLVNRFHRVEWNIVEGNPAKRAYDHFCESYGGRCVYLTDTCKDPDGNWHGTYIYEIVKKEAEIWTNSKRLMM